MNNQDLSESDWIPLPEEANPIYLSAQIRGRSLKFIYALNDAVERPINLDFDMAVLSDEHVHGNGFTGAMVGMFCENLKSKDCYADFDWFRYQER